MDAGQSSLNPSSLIDLKAELHKKYESFRRAKVTQKADSTTYTTLKRKRETIPKQQKTTPLLKKSNEGATEDLDLMKSRLALEAKAKLYEKITSNKILIDDEDCERYLVDFNRKVLYSTPEPNSHEKVDSAQNVASNARISPVPDSTESPNEIHLKKHWMPNGDDKRKSEEKLDDQPVHYQNVRFNEVRDHGTGYFAFSTDESERKEQMEELNTLRQQTEEQRLATQRMQRKRKFMLEARLAKVCERRNIDKSVVQAYTTKPGSENLEMEQSIDLSSIPLPEAPEVHEKKEVKVRPWDMGKTNFPSFVSEKCKIKSQKDWVEERRSERTSEFAPPSFY